MNTFKEDEKLLIELSEVCHKLNIAISIEDIGRYLYVWGNGGKALIEFQKSDNELTLLHTELNLGCDSLFMQDLPDLLYKVIKTRKKCN